MTPVLVVCILLCAASAAPAEKENLPADVSEPQEEMMRMMIEEEEQELPEDLLPELIDGEDSGNISFTAEFQQAPGPEAHYSCPDGWSYHYGHCYKFFSTSRTWFDAVIDCYNVGAHLASTPSGWHYNFLQGLTTAGGRRDAWLGGVYIQGIWMWKDELPFSYDGWSVHYTPTSYPCVYLYTSAGWRNAKCSDTRSYICSRRAGC